MVCSDVEWKLVVGQNLEWAHVVGPNMERLRLVCRLVGIGRRAHSPVVGSLGEHALGRLGAAAAPRSPRFAGDCRVGVYRIAPRRDRLPLDRDT